MAAQLDRVSSPSNCYSLYKLGERPVNPASFRNFLNPTGSVGFSNLGSLCFLSLNIQRKKLHNKEKDELFLELKKTCRPFGFLLKVRYRYMLCFCF